MSTIPLNDTTPRVQYTATAGQTEFTFPFWATATEDLSVYVDGTLLTPVTQFSATGLLESAGGNVTLVTPAADGQIITIERNIPFERISEFQEGGTFKASILNLELSKQLAMMQQLKRDIARKIGLPPTTNISNPNLVMPEPVDGKALVFDGTSGLMRASEVSIDELDSAIAATIDSTAASATAATSAADAAATSATGAASAKAAAEAARDEALTYIGYNKVTGADTTAEPLDSKLVAGQLMFKTVVNPGGDESLSLGVSVADQAAAEAGTSNAVAMTPLRTNDAIAALSAVKKVETSGYFTPSAGGTVTFSHTLGGVPSLVLIYAKCTSADGGYSVDDIVGVGHNGMAVSASNAGHGIKLTSSAVEMKFGSTQIGQYFNWSSGAYFVMNPSSWEFFIVAAL